MRDKTARNPSVPDTSSSPDNGATGPRVALARLVSTYFGIYLAIGVLGEIPGVSTLVNTAVAFFTRLAWGSDVPDGLIRTGSGDRAADWTRFALTVGVAVVVVAVWTVGWPQRRELERRFHAVVLVFTRVALALTMIGYGAVKVLKSQFPAPNPAWLDQALGDASPMRLLWAFMGASTSYTVFTGVVECAAGALLLSRRTRLIGALAAAGAMVNVLMLNLSYDVPVKLGSSHLLAMACLVIWPERARLAALLVPPDAPSWWAGRRAMVARVAMGLLVTAGVAMTAWSAFNAYFEWGDGRPHPPHYGRYAVTEVRLGGRELPLAAARWHRFLILDGFVLIKRTDGRAVAREITIEGNQLTLGPVAEGTGLEAEEPPVETFLVTEDTDDKQARRLTLRSRRDDDEFVVVLAERESRLTSRGFHWVSEAPYNR